MGKTGKWLKNFLTGKKDKEKSSSNQNSSASSTANPTPPILIPPSTPKEKKRWSFRRSSATAAAAAGAPPKDSNSVEPISSTPPKMQPTLLEPEIEQHAMAMAAAADAAVAVAQAAADVIFLSVSANRRSSAIEEAAAIKIQSVFRSYLARKALCALKGLVKLQALVRGHLVTKQATATLRCMHALVTAQARALAQRMQMLEEGKPNNQRHSVHRKSTQDNLFRRTYNDNDRGMEENIKIVEMDVGDSKGSSKGRNSYSKQDSYQVSPAPSALIDMSPRVCSGHFEDHSFCTAHGSQHYNSVFSKPDPSTLPCDFPQPEYAESVSYEYPFFPNYMANTESSRAKVRSQSAPKQRPDAFERQPSRRRVSMEGRRNVPRAVRMQRSSSHVGATAQNYQYPWSIKLDRSAVSLKDSECGSTSTVLTNTNYCRSLAAYDPHGNRCSRCKKEENEAKYGRISLIITDTLCKKFYELIESYLLDSLPSHRLAPYNPNGVDKASELPDYSDINA